MGKAAWENYNTFIFDSRPVNLQWNEVGQSILVEVSITVQQREEAGSVPTLTSRCVSSFCLSGYKINARKQ